MNQDVAPLELSRSLTVIGGSPRDTGPKLAENMVMRAESGFVAQLLAVRHGAPEYRVRRRAEPGSAMAAYARAQGSPASAMQTDIAA
jgi:hypothetical protein